MVKVAYRMPSFRLVQLFLAVALVGVFTVLAVPTPPAVAYPLQGSYKDLPIENCADPAVTNVTGSDGVVHWYMYCTTDPLNDNDRNRDGSYTFHLIPMLHSTDLVTWDYVGDVFSKRPSWLGKDAALWAPDIQFFNNTWYLYYSVSKGKPGGGRDGGGSYIRVATSSSPAGPWRDSGKVTVESQTGRWVFDPFVVLDEASNQRYIFYGSYVGGISARKLSNDGLTSDKASERPIAVADRYEGSFVRRVNGYYYLFASSTNCCNDHLTGYSVFVGRSANLLGPYVDRDGASFLDAQVGGTPVISMNGNRWTGPGHNSILTDFGGQDWMVYHAVDRGDPHFAGSPGFTKRAALLDPLDWVGPDANNLWPTVRGGRWASETADPATLKPAAQPGSATTYTVEPATMDTPGTPIASLSDEFDGSTLGSQWSWVREPAAGTAGLTGIGAFAFNTQAADLHKDQNNASVFLEPEPVDSTTGAPIDYVLETKVQLTVPASGFGYNYVQAGLVIYGDDNNYVKLVHVAINGTRQTEFAKEDIVAGGPRFGNTVVGAPAEWTYLRLVKRTDATNGEQEYTAYTSRDGASWVRGGTWTHTFGSGARIGLVSMGGSGYTANFDYVRVSTVTP